MQRHQLFDPDGLTATAWLMDPESIYWLGREIEEAYYMSGFRRRAVRIGIKPGARHRTFWVSVRLYSIERRFDESGYTYWYCKGTLRANPELRLPSYLTDSAYYDGCHVSLCVCPDVGGKIWRSVPKSLKVA